MNQNFNYWIEAGDARSETFEVIVRDEPTLVIDSIDYVPPAYTQLPRRVSRVPAIEAFAGTTVTVKATTNRPIVSGRIEFNPRRIRGRMSSTAGFAPLMISEDGRLATATWELKSSVGGSNGATIDSYRLIIEDEAGTTNPDPIVYPIRVIPDLAPEIRITLPTDWPKERAIGIAASHRSSSTRPRLRSFECRAENPPQDAS